MTLRRYIVLLLVALSLLAGCKKKQKPQPPAPPPTIVPQAQAAPPQQTQQTQTQIKPEQQQPEEAKTEPKVQPRPKPRTRKPPHPKPSSSEGTDVAKVTPPKPIAPPEESGLGDISTRMPNSTADQLSSQTTEQLLKSTEDNLNKVKRALNVDEQSMLKHIRGFITEAKQAMVDGDAVRAHNLALKARQLSQELVTP